MLITDLIKAVKEGQEKSMTKPQQEPVDFEALIVDIECIDCRYRGDPSYDRDAYWMRDEVIAAIKRHASLYTTPPQRTPITDEDIRQANHHMVCGAYDYSFKQGVRWAEKVHGIKWEWEK